MTKQKFTPGRGIGRRPLSVDGMVPRSTKYVRLSAAQAAGVRHANAPKKSAAYGQSVYRSKLRARRRTAARSFRRKLVMLVSAAMFIAGFVAYGHMTSGGNEPTHVKAAALPVSEAAQPAEAAAPAPAMPDISGDMNAAISAQSGLTASASLIDLNTGQEYDAGNYSEQYEAASTSKLVAIFDYIHQVELGKATLTQNVNGDSAQNNIMRMIVYSDNDAWTRMNQYLKMRGEQAYVNSLGLSATIQVNNIQFSTPNMAKMLQMLYTGKLMNDTHRAMIYDYMAHTTVKNLIQAALPADATVYHKYGQIDGVLHDASIVEYQGHHFVLVVYTNNPAGTSSKYNLQVSLIHAITTAAFKDITASGI